MIKIDLVTGFLGSGKTTFIKQYAKHLIEKGERIGILENDYGPINVDMMLLNELRGESLEIEMISGGCDLDCHRRRFKTKLIQMAMSGYTRVIVEPSGIFDTDEFYDLVYDEPLDNFYEIANVITIFDSNMTSLDTTTRFLLGNQLASCGIVIASKAGNKKREDILAYLNGIMKDISCARVFDLDLILYDNTSFTLDDFNKISNAKYHSYSYLKKPIAIDEAFDSLYFMNESIDEEKILSLEKLFDDPLCGQVLRIKGFYRKDNKWFLLNMTKDEKNIDEISCGQDVIIVIGSNLDEKRIRELL